MELVFYWNKRKVDRIFREEWMPEVRAIEKEIGFRDFTLRSTTYNNYVDSLQRDGLLNSRQVNDYIIPKDLITTTRKKK